MKRDVGGCGEEDVGGCGEEDVGGCGEEGCGRVCAEIKDYLNKLPRIFKPLCKMCR